MIIIYDSNLFQKDDVKNKKFLQVINGSKLTIFPKFHAWLS